MKETWEMPRIAVEKFAPNEYVSSCLTVKLECAIPGASDSQVDDGTRTRRDSYGMLHGLCGNDSTSFVSGSTGEGFETIGGVVQRDRPISNVSFGAANPSSYSAGQPTYGSYVSGPGTYYATWTSYDGANKTGTYSHYGRAIVTNIDNARPNHS
jgi:hypothetical protein